MIRRERGATVSVMWLIFMIVLLLGAGAYIYFVQSEIQKARTNEAKAQRAYQEMDDALLAARESHKSLSDLVGFFDAAGAKNNSSKAAISSKIEELKGRYPNDVASGDTTIEAVFERLIALADAEKTAAAEAASNFSAETAKRTEAETAKGTLRTSFEDQLSSVNSELRDARDSASSAASQADTQISSLQDQLGDAATQIREVRTDAENKLAQQEQAKTTLAGRNAELSQKLTLLGTDEDPMAVDGTIVDVGERTKLVYIDIGSRDLLRAGVKFDVYRHDKGGALVRKGSIEVRDVDTDSAMGAIAEELSALDPIAPGDVLVNPAFNRDRSKVFALIGTFPVLGRNFIESRLRAQGAEVESEVTAHCDFVILGMKAPDEDAQELAELPGYKTAQTLNIQMLPVRSIDHFLRP